MAVYHPPSHFFLNRQLHGDAALSEAPVEKEVRFEFRQLAFKIWAAALGGGKVERGLLPPPPQYLFSVENSMAMSLHVKLLLKMKCGFVGVGQSVISVNTSAGYC